MIIEKIVMIEEDCDKAYSVVILMRSLRQF